MKTFRIPEELDEVLSEAARDNDTSLTEQYVLVLRNYVRYDRLARKFGFVSLSKSTLRALLEALSEEQLREVAASQSGRVDALSEFFFKKKDRDSVLGVIDLFSKYGGLFEYTTALTEGELVVTLRTDLGSKGAFYLAQFWEPALKSILGPVQKVEIVENQVTFWVKLKN